MSAIARPLGPPSTAAGRPAAIAFTLLLFAALGSGTGGLEGGGGAEADEGGGCNPLHGLAIGGGAVVVGGKACLRGGDEMVGAIGDGARHIGPELGGVGKAGDGLASGAGTVGRVGDGASSGAGAVGRGALDGGADLAELPLLLAAHPEVAAHMDDAAFVAAYAAKNPSFYADVGVEIYLTDPAAWTRLGASAADQSAALSGRAFQAAIRTQADDAAAATLSELTEASSRGALDAARVADIGRRHGVVAELAEDGLVKMSIDSNDWSFSWPRVALDATVRLMHSEVQTKDGGVEWVASPMRDEASDGEH